MTGVMIPPLDSLLPAYLKDESVRDYVTQNFDKWRQINGALELARATKRPFDPRDDYWRLPERRLLIAYVAKRLFRRYAPPAAMRSLAFGLFRHFDTARGQGSSERPAPRACKTSSGMTSVRSFAMLPLGSRRPTTSAP